MGEMCTIAVRQMDETMENYGAQQRKNIYQGPEHHGHSATVSFVNFFLHYQF